MDSRWFVRAADEIVSRLEFASATPGRHWSLGGRLHGLDCLLVDLKAAAAGRGLDGAQLYGHAHQLKEELAVAVEHHDEGDLATWRSGRDRVFDLLAAIRASCPVPPVAPATPRVRQAAQAATPTTAVDHLEEPVAKKGERGERVRNPGGRPRKGREASRPAEAGWWRDHADLFEEIRNVDLGDNIPQLFELLTEYGEISLRGLGQEPLPAWWPNGPDKRPFANVRFRDQFATVSADTFKKYVERYENDQERPIAHRHHQHNVEPIAEPFARNRREHVASAATGAIGAIEAAIELVGKLVIEPHRREQIIAQIRDELSARAHWIDDDVDHLCELSPEEMSRMLQRRREKIENASRELAGGTKTRG
jgi:hypothetical protein